MYGVELFYEALPEISGGDLLAALRRRSADIAPLGAERGEPPWVFEHTEHRLPASLGGGNVRCLVGLSTHAPDLQALEAALSQSWTWPQAADALGRCRASVLVTDLMSDGLHHLERLVLFENVLVAVLQAYPCLAIHWQPTQQIVHPREFLTAVEEAGGLVFTPGPLNVRLFRFFGPQPTTPASAPALAASEERATGDVLMDTLGLTALGLTDLQCHFTGLDPQAVARVLFNTGIYLMERGPVIEDGHTVPGIGADEKWPCHRKPSFALPDRIVIDLDPGAPFSARDRRSAADRI